MSDPIITNIDVANFVIDDGEYESGLLTAAGAVTFKEGTILARDTSTLKFVPFVVGGVTQTISAWLAGDVSLSSEELVDQLSAIVDAFGESSLFRD